MKFKQRVDKLEKAISEIQFAQSGTRICFQEHGQTQEEAMAAAGIDPDDDALTIFVMHWSAAQIADAMACDSELQPEPETVADIDKQIEKVKNELLADGMTGEQIAEIEGSNR